MKCIDELIASLDNTMEREENDIIKANLALIKGLLPKIQNSQERLYMEKIIGTFCEIVDIQRDIINASDYADMIAAGFGPTSTTAYVTTISSNQMDVISEIEQDKAAHSYLPTMGEFQTDDEVRKAFYNYLKYHTIKETKDGRQKPLSKHTIYDYCSRIRVLYETFLKDWQEGNLDGKISTIEETILPGKSFLNAYNIIITLRRYVMMKDLELRQNPNVERDGAEINPLDNPKNLGNTIAALTKFEAFKRCVLAQI